MTSYDCKKFSLLVAPVAQNLTDHCTGCSATSSIVCANCEMVEYCTMKCMVRDSTAHNVWCNNLCKPGAVVSQEVMAIVIQEIDSLRDEARNVRLFVAGKNSNGECFAIPFFEEQLSNPVLMERVLGGRKGNLKQGLKSLQPFAGVDVGGSRFLLFEMDETSAQFRTIPVYLLDKRVCGKCHKRTEHENEHWSRCSRCRSAIYCSKECQHDDWQKHKPLCKSVKLH